jgi:hypothetical protein
VNFNRYVGVEGEVSGAIGISQSLDFRGCHAGGHEVAASAQLQRQRDRPRRSWIGGALRDGGIGGQTLFDSATLGIADTETFLTGNVGAGVKWYAGRWGLRGDYGSSRCRARTMRPRSGERTPDMGIASMAASFSTSVR